MNNTLLNLSKKCGETLHRNGWKVTTAESCTGGWIAQCITAVAGSSEWFETGFVTYSNAAKQTLLNVPVQCLEGPQAPGAVSEETALAMATGALRAAQATFAVATTGIAGPGGAVSGKPIGTVWLGWAWRAADSQQLHSIARLHVFVGDREEVRRQAVKAALEGLLQIFKEQQN